MIRIVRYHAVLIAMLLLAAASVPASADTTLAYTGAAGRYSIYMRPGDVRINGEGSQWQLYRAHQAALLSVDPSDKSFTRLDKRVAGAIRRQLDALRARVEARIARLPKAQRAAARAAMAKQVPGMYHQTQKTGLDATGGNARVAGVSCQIVQIVRSGRPAHQLCVASANALGLSGATFATVKSMFGLLQHILTGTGLEGIGLPYRSLSGMPVRFVDSISGQRRSLVGVSHQKIPNSRFQIPDDYVEKAPALPQR